MVTIDFNFKRNIKKANPQRFLRASDGDTPVIEQPIRLVSVDTPEKNRYAGGPTKSQPKLDECKNRLENGFYDNIPKQTRDYLIAKLTNQAAQKHIDAGFRATAEFEKILEDRLTKPNDKERKLGVIPTGEVVDRYGRLLAYIVPWYDGDPKDPLPPKSSPDRKTFNLNLVENGWGCIFPIYPSLPRNDDLNVLINAAENAWNNKLGMWKEFGEDILLAYEFRLCIKLHDADDQDGGIRSAFQRICIDVRTMKNVGQFGFVDVPPPYRLWVWNDDVNEAKIALDFTD